MNILVTGGAGYIGSHACKVLSAAGYTPIVYDSMVYGHPWAVKWGPMEIGDIADRKRLDEVIGKYRPDAVMHFAAYAYVGESVLDPGKYYQNNVSGTLVLLEAMRDHKINKMVFSSTCATYGIPKKVPITENQPQYPINPYGKSKLMIEQILEDFSYAHGLRFIALRYFNAAGADYEAGIGEMHEPETHLIPLLLDAAADNESIKIFGDNYKTHDGTCIRDYIHVTDLANAHLLSLQALEKGVTSGAYNLGSAKGYSVFEVLASVQKVTGRQISFDVTSRREGDPAILVADASLAACELGWEPKYKNLDEIIRSAWLWRLSLVDQ